MSESDDTLSIPESKRQRRFTNTSVPDTSYFCTPTMATMSAVSTPNHLPYQPMFAPPSPQYQQFTCTLPEEEVTKITKSIQSSLQTEIVKEIKTVISYMFDEFAKEMKNEIKTLKNENDALRSENESLKLSIDELEQYSRRNAIRITGIRENENETTDELVKDLAKKIDVDINDTDIDRSHRSGKPGTNRQILIKFTNYNIKRRLMKARGKLLSAEGCRNIYISEDLTKRRQSLFQGARQLLKEKKITKVWTWDGKVFLTDINLQKHKIDCHNDLSKFTCASPLYSDILQSSVSAQGAHGPHR
ncbi:hypothetical protein KUTeg_017799 [Tegillarca granosa]|uniref:Uncharacterized protein n=1 Tax=Tegillarca granosa TaxID=220873 RepID=A0ABQ9EIG6_TEGGR|nr:hypothetical protein KUTeg_017799 [Tegillarca granosa]